MGSKIVPVKRKLNFQEKCNFSGFCRSRKKGRKMPNSKDCELNGIEGLTFYDQEDFEQNVTKKLDDQIDKQKKEHDAKRLQLELKSVESNLEKAEKNAAKVEQALHNAVAKGITSDRRLQGFL